MQNHCLCPHCCAVILVLFSRSKYLVTIVRNAPLETAMDEYHKLVPKVGGLLTLQHC